MSGGLKFCLFIPFYFIALIEIDVKFDKSKVIPAWTWCGQNG